MSWPRIAIVVLILLAGAVVATLTIAARRGVEQPLAFSHQLHVTELGSECGDCHLYALSGVRAGIPNVEQCADCHEEAQSDSPEEARLVGYIASGEKVPWRKVYRVPDHVFFSHRRHAAIAAIACEVCHGPIADRVLPVSRPHWRPTMDNCMDCHEESGVSNDCIFCHF